jgi:hypothetical protein
VLVKSTKLSREFVVLSLLLAVNTSLAINILTGNEKSVFSFFAPQFSALDLADHISIAAILEIHVLAKVIVFSSSAFVVGTEVSILTVEFLIQVTDSHELTLAVFESTLLGAEISATSIDETCSVVNSHLGAGDFRIEVLLLVLLSVSFSSFLISEIFKVGDFSPHFSTLDLDSLNISF